MFSSNNACNALIMISTIHHHLLEHSTVLPAKSDSDVMFCLQCIGDLESIDHLCINPIHRIGLIHK